MRSIFFILLSLATTSGLFCQDYTYVQYDTRDGLAGSTVYDLCQDKEGFLWFATETGLSRFDGTHFVNFTTQDGLPDNEVLKLFPDSKGRVWIGALNKSICYYYKGEIHNSTNDSLVRKIKLNDIVRFKAELSRNRVLLSDGKSIVVIDKDNQINTLNVDSLCAENEYCAFAEQRYVQPERLSLLTSRLHEYFFYDEAQRKFKKLRNLNAVQGLEDVLYINSINTDSTIQINTLLRNGRLINSLVWYYYSLTWIATNDGAWTIDTLAKTWKEQFLPGKRVSNVWEDKEGNTWFSTLGEGVFKLQSKESKTIFLNNNRQAPEEVFSIIDNDENIIMGSNNGDVYEVDSKRTLRKIIANWKNQFTKRIQGNISASNRVYCMESIANNHIILGTDLALMQSKNGQLQLNPLYGIKSIQKINPNSILVGSFAGMYRVDLDHFEQVKVIYSGRTTCVGFSNNRYYAGTPNGLMEISANGQVVSLGEKFSELSKRITAIQTKADGSIWVATGDQGVVCYQSGKIVSHFTAKEGLASNICKCLYLQDQTVWVGTNKGISRIEWNGNNSSLTNYSISDGLPSNSINAILVKDSTVWVASPTGLTFFNPLKIANTSRCDLILTSIETGSQKKLADADSLLLPFNDRSIRFNFVAISFKSGGDITYRYQLLGLTEQWQETKLNTLSFLTLPPGDYQLVLQAVNKYGVKSKVVQVAFTIQKAWYQTAWFLFGCFALGVGLIWWIIAARFTALNRSKEEQLQLKQKIADLEQQALRSQMNPHFIFNCLNSIQGFIFNNDMLATNRYLNEFSFLLRKNLDTSNRKSISIKEEIEYLNAYLHLEKMRFGDLFNYEFSIADNIAADFTFIPSMVLQPFIENSIRHGIRYKSTKNGIIRVSFVQTEKELLIEIYDNGIGRTKSAELKSIQHIEYQSKGMELTLTRLQLLNSNKGEHIITEIIDLTDDSGTGIGTTIRLHFPLSIINQLHSGS